MLSTFLLSVCVFGVFQCGVYEFGLAEVTRAHVWMFTFASLAYTDFYFVLFLFSEHHIAHCTLYNAILLWLCNIS